MSLLLKAMEHDAINARKLWHPQTTAKIPQHNPSLVLWKSFIFFTFPLFDKHPQASDR